MPPVRPDVHMPPPPSENILREVVAFNTPYQGVTFSSYPYATEVIILTPLVFTVIGFECHPINMLPRAHCFTDKTAGKSANVFFVSHPSKAFVGNTTLKGLNSEDANSKRASRRPRLGLSKNKRRAFFIF